MNDNNKFLMYSLKKNIVVGFSTAENYLNFNKGLVEGVNNLEALKKWFSV